MNTNDIQLLGKKIIVGVLIYLIPLVIITGSLWLTNHLFKKNKERQTQQNLYEYENRIR
jgi:hypothetical protein